MVKTLGIVEVGERSGQPSAGVTSSPFANRRFGDKSLLEWVVRRVTDCLKLDKVAVVCPQGPQEMVVRQCAPPDVSVYVGQASDALGDLASAARQYHAEAVVRIQADQPFVDPELIDCLVVSAESDGGCDYASFSLSDGRPAVLSQIGVVAEWCRSEAIYRADVQAERPLDRQQSTRFLYRHPEQFQSRLLPVPPQLDRDDLRLAVDIEEDWEHAQLIFDALGPDSLEWQQIAGLLDHHPALRERMAVLNRTQAIA